MFERYKWILAIIVGGMVFSGIAILDELVIKVIFSGSGVVAYSIVGSLISTGLITSRADAGRARTVIFVILIAIFLSIYIMIIKILTWILSLPLWVYILIFIITSGLLVLRFILNKKIESRYVKSYEKDKTEEVENVETNIELHKNQDIHEKKEELKTIYQLLAENKDKDVIYVERVDSDSQGLQYVQVNQNALNYSVLRGYLKFDNAGIFREIYYADKKIWRLSNYLN